MGTGPGNTLLPAIGRRRKVARKLERRWSNESVVSAIKGPDCKKEPQEEDKNDMS